MSKDLDIDLKYISCKYYLPCGKCDKTNELCSYHIPHPSYPKYDEWPWWRSPWSDGTYEITYTTGTDYKSKDRD